MHNFNRIRNRSVCAVESGDSESTAGVGPIPQYLVYMPDAKDTIESVFTDHHNVADGFWVVNTPISTCAAVCEKLETGENRLGVVFSLNEYYGYYDRALWQKLDAWSQAS